jgi:hypothetical protein
MTLEETKKAFAEYLNSADPDASLYEIHKSFVIEKMKMDKYFSIFLDDNEHEMNLSENYDSPAWVTYKQKMKEYNDIERFVNQSRYYLSKTNV